MQTVYNYPAFARQDHFLPPEEGGTENDDLLSAEQPFCLKQPRKEFTWPEQYLHPKCVHRDAFNAIIQIHRKTEPYRRPIRIWFEINGTGEYFLEDVIEEREQWLGRRSYLPVPLLFPRTETYRGDHEWYAARKHAVKAIAYYRKKFGMQREALPPEALL